MESLWKNQSGLALKKAKKRGRASNFVSFRRARSIGGCSDIHREALENCPQSANLGPSLPRRLSAPPALLTHDNWNEVKLMVYDRHSDTVAETKLSKASALKEQDVGHE
jgi:hypothetical protein